MRRYSFTMLEMVAVLLIIVIVSLLALQNFHTSDETAAAHGNQLLDLLSYAHSRAMTGGEAVEILWRSDRHAWQCGSRELPAPEALDVRIGGAVPEPDRAVFAFYPDGSARAVRVELQGPENRAEVRCHPLSGTAEIATASGTGDEPAPVQPLWLREEE